MGRQSNGSEKDEPERAAPQVEDAQLYWIRMALMMLMMMTCDTLW